MSDVLLPLQFRALTPPELPWPLLLEADPSREQIERYIANSSVFGAFSDAALAGVLVLTPRGASGAEITNIAVTPECRGMGIGRQLIQFCLQHARDTGLSAVEIATGNSSIGQLALYQKCGFRIVRIEPDYFIRHYPEPIWENGIQCRDQVVLRCEFGTPVD